MLQSLRSTAWYFGIASWCYGLSDRTFAAIADGFYSSLDISLASVASFHAAIWLIMRPIPMPFAHQIRIGLWWLCLGTWSFGAGERAIAASTHLLPHPSGALVAIALFYLGCWLSLRPKHS